MVLTCIIGGIGTVSGPIFGALVVVVLTEAFRASLGPVHLLVYGVLVIVVILVMPEGFLGFISQRLRRKAATR
jgi:branched-chain amino acid transport system permease protein